MGHSGSATKSGVNLDENDLKSKAVAWMCAQRGLCDPTKLIERDMQCSNHFKCPEQYFLQKGKQYQLWNSQFLFSINRGM